MQKKPKTESGKLDKEAVRKLYMESKHIEWVPFAEDHGWHPYRSRNDFPVRTWIEEKKKALGIAEAQRLSEALCEQKNNWHWANLRYLEEMPQILFDLVSIVSLRIKEAKDNESTGDRRISVDTLNGLIRATKQLSEIGAKSLNIEKWSFERAEAMDPPENQSLMPKITVEGKTEVTVEEMWRWYEEFADKPMDEPAKPPSVPPPNTQHTILGVTLLDDSGKPV